MWELIGKEGVVGLMGCHCGADVDYSRCCGRFLEGDELPATAEELMRSRYVAYKLGDFDYMERTQVDPFDRETAQFWFGKIEWIGLRIKSVEGGGEGDREGVVEFVATYTLDGHRFEHRERSQFIRVDGGWKYVKGQIWQPPTLRRSVPRIGRNDPCPCGSGRKFKRCCGKKDSKQI